MFHLGYKNQAVYVIFSTSRCLLQDKYQTHKYSVGRTYNFLILNLLVQDCVCNADKMCKALRFSSRHDEISRWGHYNPLKYQELFIINNAQELNLPR
jgi:hypothetical protein